MSHTLVQFYGIVEIWAGSKFRNEWKIGWAKRRNKHECRAYSCVAPVLHCLLHNLFVFRVIWRQQWFKCVFYDTRESRLWHWAAEWLPGKQPPVAVPTQRHGKGVFTSIPAEAARSQTAAAGHRCCWWLQPSLHQLTLTECQVTKQGFHLGPYIGETPQSLIAARDEEPSTCQLGFCFKIGYLVINHHLREQGGVLHSLVWVGLVSEGCLTEPPMWWLASAVCHRLLVRQPVHSHTI